MSVIESIIRWAQRDLSDWQSDAVRRLLTQKELTDKDESEILSMVKSLHGINNKDYHPVTPKPLKESDIPGSQNQEMKLTLKAMDNLRNVNAIPNGSGLLFGHKGLSVIYGENGAGKSGYARVMKRACRARDSKERILPNVFQKESDGFAKANFKISINGEPDKVVSWKDQEDFESPLSNITVFDSRSANIIVDGNNGAAYLPHGAFVFEALVFLLKKLRDRLEHEKPVVKKFEYKDITANTEAGKMIAELSYTTQEEAIKTFAVWDDENKFRLDKLRKEIGAAEINDPLKQARKIRNLKDRIEGIVKKVDKIEDGFSAEKAKNLRRAIDKLVEAQKAVKIASQENGTDEPLSGMGENVWQLLYNAAKDYSIQWAYPEKEFPETGEGSRCVLCMQPLADEAKARMKRFKEFMENTTKKQEEVAMNVLENQEKTMKEINIPTLESIKDVLDEIRDKDENIVFEFERFIVTTEKRAREMIQAASDKYAGNFTSMEDSPREDLVKIMNQLENEAKEKEKNADPDSLNELKKEQTELQAKKLLTERKQEVLDYLIELKKAHKYDQCMAQLSTTSITRKGKSIVSEALTPRLTEALQKELEELGAKHLPLNLRSSGSGGETKHQIQLQEKQAEKKAKLSEILSEGEQRITALTGFFAELELGQHECPIVFDDPVSSLDQRYREKIAERLVKESLKRQVVVFTHDIAFLLALETKAGESQEDVHFYAQTVRRTGGSAGESTDSRPWHAMNVIDRTKYLNIQLQQFRSLYQPDTEAYNERAAKFYALLRETWESLIERDLLNETVYRYSEKVQTQRLKAVEVSVEDYKTIDSGMAKCSAWMLGHDKSAPLDANRPSPDELQTDLNQLKAFGKMIRTRREDLQRERNAALRPLVSEIG